MIKKTYQVEKDNYQDAGKASSDIKKTLKALQIDRKILKAVAIASYEAEINIAIHLMVEQLLLKLMMRELSIYLLMILVQVSKILN